MKLETAKKLKFGDRVFVKHTCPRHLAGQYVEVCDYRRDGSFVYPLGSRGYWIDIAPEKCNSILLGMISVPIEHIKRVNVLPKDCKAGTKVRIKEGALSSIRTERGKVVKIIEIDNRELSIFYGWAKLEFSPRSGFGNGYQCVKLSELELYFA